MSDPPPKKFSADRLAFLQKLQGSQPPSNAPRRSEPPPRKNKAGGFNSDRLAFLAKLQQQPQPKPAYKPKPKPKPKPSSGSNVPPPPRPPVAGGPPPPPAADSTSSVSAFQSQASDTNTETRPPPRKPKPRTRKIHSAAAGLNINLGALRPGAVYKPKKKEVDPNADTIAAPELNRAAVTKTRRRRRSRDVRAKKMQAIEDTAGNAEDEKDMMHGKRWSVLLPLPPDALGPDSQESKEETKDDTNGENAATERSQSVPPPVPINLNPNTEATTLSSASTGNEEEDNVDPVDYTDEEMSLILKAKSAPPPDTEEVKSKDEKTKNETSPTQSHSETTSRRESLLIEQSSTQLAQDVPKTPDKSDAITSEPAKTKKGKGVKKEEKASGNSNFAALLAKAQKGSSPAPTSQKRKSPRSSPNASRTASPRGTTKAQSEEESKKSPKKTDKEEASSHTYENGKKDVSLEVKNLKQEIEELEKTLAAKKAKLAELERHELNAAINNSKPVMLMKQLNDFCVNADKKQLEILRNLLAPAQ